MGHKQVLNLSTQTAVTPQKNSDWPRIRQGPLILLNSKKELSQISRTTGQKIVKLCENLRQGNRNHHEGFHGKRANISATYNDLKFVAIFGQDVPIQIFLTYRSKFTIIDQIENHQSNMLNEISDLLMQQINFKFKIC